MCRKTSLIVAALVVSLVGFGERVRVENPWLIAYDPRGRPTWELSAAEVQGSSAGWTAADVTVRIYGAGGEVAIEARVAELQTDAQGSRWSSASPAEGEGRNFRFRAERVRWEGEELKLDGLQFVSGDLALTAQAATWRRDGTWYLVGVAANYGEWELEFPEGLYRQDEEILQITEGLVARGWGWEVRAQRATVDIPTGTVTLQEVEVGEA